MGEGSYLFLRTLAVAQKRPKVKSTPDVPKIVEEMGDVAVSLLIRPSDFSSPSGFEEAKKAARTAIRIAKKTILFILFLPPN
jgi:hypothetical protein